MEKYRQFADGGLGAAPGLFQPVAWWNRRSPSLGHSGWEMSEIMTGRGELIMMLFRFIL